MPGAGRIRTLVRAGLLATAVLAVVFAPAALSGAGTPDAADLAAAVLAPSDDGDAWRPVVPDARTDDVGSVLLAVLAVAVAVPSTARRRTRRAVEALVRAVPLDTAPPSDRAPPPFVVV